MRALSLASPLLAGLVLIACDGGSSGRSGATAAGVGSAAATGTAVIVLQLGPELPPRVQARVAALVGAADPRPVEVAAAGSALRPLPAGSLWIAVGETEGTRSLIPAADVRARGSEAFQLRSADLGGGVTLVAADGNPPAPDVHHLGVNRGAIYGAYALLEALGIAFLHPLEPTLPAGLSPPAAPLDVSEAPRWPIRSWHLHTMHPLELTDLLNGWGPSFQGGAGPNDEPGWRAMLPEWELCLEWLLANRQNEVEWVLLGAESWRAFSDGPVRQARLKELVDLGHAWGMGVGVDASLALKQQHAFALLRRTGQLADEVREIEQRLDWLLDAGFDFVSTEMGFSEFTHPDDHKMVAWLDAFTAKVEARGKHGLVKIHISQGQTAPNYPDPNTGAPINFNFLAHYCDPRLGVMPHTVQHYALDDPAPTYGATDFGYMREFLQQEVGRRRVVWHPETTYWVSFDIDVPLFLPIYGERRLRDLRLLAGDERAGRMGRGAHAGGRMDGQSVFSSGWEWGYWLGEVVTARAVWDPQEQEPSDEAAFRRALDPVVRPFGAAADPLRDALVELVQAEQELLIEGRVSGLGPSQIERRNGQAYLQGLETWDEVAEIALRLPLGVGPATTQPSRLSLMEMRMPAWLRPPGSPDYRREVAPLLQEMATRFQASADALERLGPSVPAEARGLWEELRDAARMTALRAIQVQGLYEYVDADRQGNRAAGLPWLAAARAALDQAARIVQAREAAYRVPADRIAGWGNNPTCYEFGYLWTARSLHFWWRDEGQAVDAPWSPAYLNIIDPIDTAFGEGAWTPLGPLVRDVGQRMGWSSVTDFFAPPAAEPVYPPAGLRSRP